MRLERWLSCRDVWHWFKMFIAINAVLWLVLLAAIQWVQPVSRRACNMPYVLLSLAMNWMMVVLFAAGSALSSDCRPLLLLDRCSQNMLPLFLLANVLTGFVNMTMNSLLVTDGRAIGIVSVYMLVICCMASILHRHHVHLKITPIFEKR